MKTGNKFKGNRMRALCRKSQKALKKTKKELRTNNLKISRVHRDIYKEYGTLEIYFSENGQPYSMTVYF